MLRVQPEPCERLAGDGFRLRNLVLVMRKDQVDAAGVNIQRLAQIPHRHRRTFDMPARTSIAKGCVPKRLIAFAPFPQHEVAGIGLFVFV